MLILLYSFSDFNEISFVDISTETMSYEKGRGVEDWKQLSAISEECNERVSYGHRETHTE
jgi:hypothetical protein